MNEINDVVSRYSVTENGEVFDKVNQVFLHAFRKPDGYLYMTLLVEAKTKQRFGWVTKDYPLADLVLRTFTDEPQSKRIVCFLDGNFNNCRLGNLCWGIKKQRSRLRTLFLEAHPGAMPLETNLGRGKGSARTKLTQTDALQIRQLIITGQYKQTDLAKIYGVTRFVINDIIKGRTHHSG